MVLLAQATDAIERALQGRSSAHLIATGAGLVAVGLLASTGVARLFSLVTRGRPIEKPPPSPLPASFRPALLPVTIALILGPALVWRWLAGPRRGAGEAAAEAVDLHAFGLSSAIVAAVLVLGLFRWTRHFGGGLLDLGLRWKAAARPLALAVALYVAYAPVQLGALALESGACGLLGREPQRQQAVLAFASDPLAQRDLVVLIGFVVCAPLVEELLFRGVLQRFLGRLLPPWLAIGATAACFTLPHDGGRLAVFALGAALSWLMARTGNLLAPLLFHMLHNGLVLFLIARTGGA